MNVHNQTSISASVLGKLAAELIANRQNASIMGVTSRGSFIKTDTRWLFFLSNEAYRGPLTVNFATGIPAKLNMHAPVHLQDREITIPDAQLTIMTGTAEIWQPTSPSLSSVDQQGIQSRLIEFQQSVMRKKPDVKLARLLEALTGQSELKAKNDQPAASLREKIRRLSLKVKHKDWDKVTPSVAGLLGAGSGLTPSGDDFAIGFLLTLNRWMTNQIDPEYLAELNATITAAAYKNTTILSANLIECAAQGLADERLIDGIDALITDTPKPELAIKALLTWGNSSGVDALVGMTVALSIFE
ncbi:MAG: DUF2877 domain-containing protein [Anaerolineales bacterium]|nr:DUF2877 domain-containing protein [Anaerolineales bacterium]